MATNIAETSAEAALHPPGASALQFWIAVGTAVAIALHLILRFGCGLGGWVIEAPLLGAILLGSPLVWGLAKNLIQGNFGSDLLAGISITTALILGEYLAGALVVLMLSGGAALESYAAARASSVLEALARRMPRIAHRRRGDALEEISTADIAIGDHLVVLPHELCPVDGVVLEGRGTMDESYLTGEPFRIEKTPGAEVISGAINGQTAITIEATRLAIDSRYAKIMQVMRETELRQPPLRRLGDRLGALYTPLALAIAGVTWFFTGEADRFLAVLVVATPCPLLIAIPVAIIGAISLAAHRGIIIKNPVILEQLRRCRTMIFDKTGTLTYGSPEVAGIRCGQGFTEDQVAHLTASLERYSKHPLAQAIVNRGKRVGHDFLHVESMSERPGEGLRGTVGGSSIEVTSRTKLAARGDASVTALPPTLPGLECIVLVDGAFAGAFQFHDAIRADSCSFVRHLSEQHRFDTVMLVSGDRESEVRYLAEAVGITDIHASQSPEDKVAIVHRQTARGGTVFVGDGINDAPALKAATVGIAFGKGSEITSEAADAVVLETSLEKVDELFHISDRMYTIAMQSAVGGMLLSIGGMGLAAAGILTPVAGAVFQEIIDLFAVLNALRVAFAPKELIDYERVPVVSPTA
jgi:heavy metal translocating P-type ATPase